MINFVCTPTCFRITLTVAMETMQFFIVLLGLSLRTKILCISVVPMNDLAPMKKCPGGAKVCQICSRVTKVVGGSRRKNVCTTYARTDARPDKAISFDPST